MDSVKDKTNYSRACQLLVDEGGDELRAVLHVKLSPKIFRNDVLVYGHRPCAQFDDTAFETVWQKVSNPLVKLGILQQDIDELNKAPLSPEEESYDEKLKEWKELQDDILSKLDDVEKEGKKVQNEVSAPREAVGTVNPSETNQLTRFNFTASLQLRLYITRVWFFNKFSGFGKSFLSAKLFELHERCEQLAARHFCDFENSYSRNPHRILQSLASQMYESDNEFGDKLIEVLCREHSGELLSNAFCVLAKRPLLGLDRDEPMLIVVDVLDESKTNVKSVFLELVSHEFSELLPWIKILITSRPEHKVFPVAMLPDSTQHNFDLARFLPHRHKLSDILCGELYRDSLSDAFQWQFFIKLGTSQQNIDELTVNASPSFRKSFFCAKVCELYTYQQNGQHATADFYDRQCFNSERFPEVLFRLYSRESLFDHFHVLSHNQLHALGRRDALLIVVDAKTKVKTEANDFPSSEKGSDGQQCSKNKKDKKPKRKIFVDFNVPSIKKGKQKSRIRGHSRYSSAKKKIIMKHEKMSEECALKARNSLHLMKPLALMKCLRVKELEDENVSLKKQLKSLQLKYEAVCSKLENTAKENEENKSEHFRQIFQIVKELKDENLSLKKEVKSLHFKNEELLVDLGQITVEKTARENGERKSERFRQIFHSSLQGDKRSGTSHSRNDGSNNDLYQQSSDPNCFSRPPATNRSSNPSKVNASVVRPASSSEHHVNGVTTSVLKNNYQVDNEEKFTNNKIERKFHERNYESASTVSVNGDQQTATIQSKSSIQSGEQSNGGEKTNQFRGNNDQASTSRNDYGDLSFSVQQHDSGRECISLSNIPPTSVATTLYNNYKFLLLSLAQNLLSSDVVMLQDWAAQNFSINNPQNATDILLRLDQKGVINASDLHQLSDFFECIIRFDLVHIIDAFLLGDYNLLRQSQASKKCTENLVQNQGHRAILRNPGFLNAVSTSQFSMNTNRTLGTSGNPANNNEAQNSLPQTQPQSLRNFSDTANSTHFVRSLKNQPTISTQSNPNKPAAGFNSVRMAEVAVGDGPLANGRRTTSGNAGTRTNPSGSKESRNTPTVNSNGSKHSKFQHPDKEQSNNRNSDPGLDSNWLCSHYKRHCYVKFDCCDKFWPCHRCHNNQSTCGRKKLKSRDTRMLKCVYCNKVQQFGEHCCNCGAKFANYFCGLCKHLTGKDDHPYHCEKCGICRIHGDRSFHCDVCGVCLDVQLRGNHKCREGSAHDDCFICFEDAFTGCQILPCSHKVHKECATQMIRRGITRCPICRESFAHKLERRPLNSRKKPGK